MASAGFEPANLGTRGQHATPRPPKPIPNIIYEYNASPLFSGVTLLDANSGVYLLHVRCARTGYHIPGNRPVKHVREMLGFVKTGEKN